MEQENQEFHIVSKICEEQQLRRFLCPSLLTGQQKGDRCWTWKLTNQSGKKDISQCSFLQPPEISLGLLIWEFASHIEVIILVIYCCESHNLIQIFLLGITITMWCLYNLRNFKYLSSSSRKKKLMNFHRNKAVLKENIDHFTAEGEVE